MSAAASCSSGGAIWRRRAPTIARRPIALTRFDELDVAMARATAQERLAALTAQGPGGATGPPHRAGHRQRRLQERPCARQSAARRQADRGLAEGCRLPDRDAGQRSHPRQVLRGAARVLRARRRRPIGRWSITPATVSRSAASTIWCRSTPSSQPTRTPRPRRWRWSR